MNTSPISNYNLLQQLPATGDRANQVRSGGNIPFQSMLESVLREVEATEAVKTADTYNLALGDVDDLGAIAVNSTKAELAMQTLIEMRNKLLDAYSEIMRMSV